MLTHSTAGKVLAKRLIARGTQARSRSLLPNHATSTHRCSPLCQHTQHCTFSTSTSSASSSLSSPFTITATSASSSSSSPSSTFFSSSFAGISALIVATGAAIIAVTTTTTEAEAEAATTLASSATTADTITTTPASPPLILPTITPGTTPYTSRPAATLSSTKQNKTPTTPPRPTLPNPGKFDHTHRESSNVCNSQAFGGARLQFGLPLFQPDQLTGVEPDKQVVFIPVVSVGEGPGNGMLNVRTSLGHRHMMEGMVDTAFNVVGEYKYNHHPWTIKPSFRSLTQQGDDLSLEVDYKGREFVAQALLGSTAQEYVLSYLRSVHRNLSLGVQLHALLGQVAFLNFTGRYNNQQGDLLSFSRKNQMLLLSYHRTVLDQPGSAVSPPVSVALASELRVHETSKQSEWAVGLQYNRPLYKYGLCVSSDWRVGVVVEQNVSGPIQLTLAGEMKYDGSGESRFGIGVSIG